MMNKRETETETRTGTPTNTTPWGERYAYPGIVQGLSPLGGHRMTHDEVAVWWGSNDFIVRLIAHHNDGTTTRVREQGGAGLGWARIAAREHAEEVVWPEWEGFSPQQRYNEVGAPALLYITAEAIACGVEDAEGALIDVRVCTVRVWTHPKLKEAGL